jgi:hypothetical protein
LFGVRAAVVELAPTRSRSEAREVNRCLRESGAVLAVGTAAGDCLRRLPSGAEVRDRLLLLVDGAFDSAPLPPLQPRAVLCRRGPAAAELAASGADVWPLPASDDARQIAISAAQPLSLVLAAQPAGPGAARRASPQPQVWFYWEGPCPEWIALCQHTILRHAPGARLLTPRAFDELWDRDRDIDLSRLHPAHRADFVRAFLLARYGGLWVDADCLVMQPLAGVLDLVREHDFVAHRERSGYVSNGFIGARPGSRSAQAYYSLVCEALRSRRELGWIELGGGPLTRLLDSSAWDWHELPCRQVQPICWSDPAAFFAVRDAADHARHFDASAICYMLSNQRISGYQHRNAQADLLREGTFFRWLVQRSLQGERAAMETLFTEFFWRNHWGGAESVSGRGSSLEMTAEIRARLPMLVADLGVRSLLDAPCGDFHWLGQVDLRLERYIGVDVVPELIRRNWERHGAAGREFRVADITRDPLPEVDLILCRDCLGHLTFEQIRAVLRNFRRSGARWLLVTTFTEPRPNREIATGDWRTLNFALPPFGFPPPQRVVTEKCTENGGIYWDKSLGLWRLADLPL